MSVKCVSDMFKQAFNLNRCYIGEVMRFVANSPSHQKAVLRNNYVAVRCSIGVSVCLQHA